MEFRQTTPKDSPDTAVVQVDQLQFLRDYVPGTDLGAALSKLDPNASWAKNSALSLHADDRFL
jgi:hypothetical protein